VKTRGCGAATLRRAEIDGAEDERAVVLAFVELELDGAVKRDNGEGGAGVCLCEGVVIGVWVLKDSEEFLAVLMLVVVLSLSSSGDPKDATLAVVKDAREGECHAGGRRRGRDDCCLGSCKREMDLGEPVDDTLAGGNIGDEGVNPALEPEGDGGKCADTGEGCERSITGGWRSLDD
jgi:hypothetical protein